MQNLNDLVKVSCAFFETTKLTQSPLVLDSSFYTDTKNIVRERIIPWEGLFRAGVISEDDTNHIKILEKQSPENKVKTVLSQLPLYSNTLLNLLNKLDVNGRDDVLKNILVLLNDLLLDLPNQEFIDSLLAMSKVDGSLPYDPFLKHLDNDDNYIKALCLHNLTVLLSKAAKQQGSENKIDNEVLIKVFDVVSSASFIGSNESSYQTIGIQILQELVISREFRKIYQKHNLVSNYKTIDHLISNLAKYPNSSSLQLSYNLLLTTWILSFNADINHSLIHNYPDLIGSLLTIAKDSIKLKNTRVSVSILKNFVSVSSENNRFRIIKIILFDDGLSTMKTLQERKFASNKSDDELANDLQYLVDTLSEVVAEKLSSLDEYLTQLDNPNLISWSSPVHKSSEFWLENSRKFKDSSFKLVKRIFEILDLDIRVLAKVILLNDVQALIKNLGQDLIKFINEENGGAYKMRIMMLLDNNGGDNELKYEALKTIQLLVGHSF